MPRATTQTSKPSIPPPANPVLAVGFALMSLVPILLAVWLVGRPIEGVLFGSLMGHRGAIVFLMLVSASFGYLFIRHQLSRTYAESLRRIEAAVQSPPPPRKARPAESKTETKTEATSDAEAEDSAAEPKKEEPAKDEVAEVADTIQEASPKSRDARSGAAARSGVRLREGLAEIAHTIDVARTGQQLQEGLVRGAVDAVDARTGYLMIVDEERGDFVTIAAAGDDADVAMNTLVPLGEGVPGHTARERRPILLTDSDEDVVKGLPRLPECTLAVPLLQGETLYGVLILHDRKGGGDAFAKEDLAVVTNLVHLCAAALRQLEQRDRLEDALDDTLRAVAKVVESRDPYARGHSSRVARYCVEMARALQLDEDTIRSLGRAAMIHDIGKIHVPETLLRKEGRFTEEELGHVRRHVEAADAILKSIPELSTLAPMVRHHHERCDGSGYPDRLNGERIPLPTHVLIVANAFDVMTSDRSYRSARSVKRALEELRNEAGRLYDARAVEALANLDERILKATGEVADGNAENSAPASISVRD